MAGGTTNLVFKFDFPPELDAQIRRDLEEKGRSTPTFDCGFFREGDHSERLTVRITNTVAIRSKHYIKATSPAAADEFAAPAALGLVQEMLRKRVVEELQLKTLHDLTEERVERVAARLGVGSGAGSAISRDEFDKMLDALGVATVDDAAADLEIIEARLRAREARDLIWRLIDVREAGEISAKDFLDFWRSTSPPSETE